MSEQDPKLGAWRLFGIWARIGLQSFGGGASTTLLIQRTFIDQQGWLTMEEFLRLWNLCLLTPGINLIALTVLLGKKMGGTKGIIASLIGLLLPSAAITCLLAALFVQIEQAPAVQAILRGVVPATGGIMLLVGLNFARPLLQHAYKAGVWSILAGSALIAVSAVVIIFPKLSVIVVVLGALCLGMLFFSPRPASSQKPDEEKPL